MLEIDSISPSIVRQYKNNICDNIKARLIIESEFKENDNLLMQAERF